MVWDETAPAARAVFSKEGLDVRRAAPAIPVTFLRRDTERDPALRAASPGDRATIARCVDAHASRVSAAAPWARTLRHTHEPWIACGKYAGPRAADLTFVDWVLTLCSDARLLSRRPEQLSGFQRVLAAVLGLAIAIGVGLSTYHWSATPAAGNPWYSAFIGIAAGASGGIAIVADLAGKFRQGE